MSPLVSNPLVTAVQRDIAEEAEDLAWKEDERLKTQALQNERDRLHAESSGCKEADAEAAAAATLPAEPVAASELAAAEPATAEPAAPKPTASAAHQQKRPMDTAIGREVFISAVAEASASSLRPALASAPRRARTAQDAGGQ